MSLQTNKRRVAIIALVIGVLGSAAALGAFGTHVAHNTIDIRVQERGGTNINISVPSALLSVAINVVPSRLIAHACEDEDLDDIAELSRVLPFMKAAQRELEKMPDCTMVSVESADGELVKVRKEAGRLIVDVQDYEDRVHVAVPIGAVNTVIRKLSRIERAVEDRHWDL